MNKEKLSRDQLAVYELIENSSSRITQSEIARHEKFLGSDEKEKHLHINHHQTTLRKVRRIIRELRIDFGAPILSDIRGYWIPNTEAEAQDYIERIAVTAKAQSKAWFETYRAMELNFKVKSEYFETQLNLFALTPIVPGEHVEVEITKE